MSVPRHHSLLDVLVAGYDSFHEKLSRRLGSDMQARDALHNVYIRLNRGDAITADSPRAYLFRMALNAATDDMRSERRTSRLKDVDAMILDLPDNGADPLRAAAARQEVRLLEQALEELTPRRRTILLESRFAWTQAGAHRRETEPFAEDGRNRAQARCQPLCGTAQQACRAAFRSTAPRCVLASTRMDARACVMEGALWSRDNVA